MSNATIYFNIDGVSYKWCGGFGSNFQSLEKGVRVGDVRWIGHELFRVFSIYDGTFFWEAKTANWVAVRDVDHKDLEEIKSKFCK